MAVCLAFVLLLALSAIGPPLLPAAFGPYPLLRWGEILDLGTPLLVLPAAWLLLRGAGREPPRTSEMLLFVAFSALWVEGQGMHFAANAIGHWVPDGGGDLQRLTHDLDEGLGHLLWHAAVIGMTGLISWRAVRERSPAESPAVAPARIALLLLAAAIFGFTFFAMVVEGATAIIGLPGAALVILVLLVSRRRQALVQPASATFVVGYSLALVLCGVWAAMNGGQLIEFSEAGLIQ